MLLRENSNDEMDNCENVMSVNYTNYTQIADNGVAGEFLW